MVLVIAQVAAIAANRGFVEIGTTSHTLLVNNSSPNRFRVIVGGATQATSVAQDPTGSARPYVLRARVDGTPGVIAVSDQEKLSPSFTAGAGKKFVLGSTSVAATAEASYLYAARWDGTKAQVSDANLKALLQAMGFTIPWS
jgi:hypothetical protein